MSPVVTASLAVLAVLMAGVAIVLATVANRRWVATGGSLQRRAPAPNVDPSVPAPPPTVDPQPMAAPLPTAVPSDPDAPFPTIIDPGGSPGTLDAPGDAWAPLDPAIDLAWGVEPSSSAESPVESALVESALAELLKAAPAQNERTPIEPQVAALADRVEELGHWSDGAQVTLGDLAEDLADVAAQVREVTWHVENLQAQALAAAAMALEQPDPTDPTALRRVALVRYDAYADVGGRLSYSVALLDDTGSGLVLTTLAGKSEVRTYVRTLSAGAPDGTLTAEEQQAIEAAMGRL